MREFFMTTPVYLTPKMVSVELEEPWGELVRQEGEEKERTHLVGSKITIGRGKGDHHA